MTERRTIYAWVAQDPQGVEGLIVVPTDIGALPLVAVELRVAMKLERAAREAAKARRHTARLVQYEQVDVLREIEW